MSVQMVSVEKKIKMDYIVQGFCAGFKLKNSCLQKTEYCKVNHVIISLRICLQTISEIS